MSELSYKIKNNQREISRISGSMAIIFLLVFLFTIHKNSFLFGLWALTLSSISLVVALLVASLIFGNRAKKLDNLLKGNMTVGEWELSAEQLNQYASTLKENALQKNKAVTWVVFAMFILIAMPFLFFLESDEIMGFLIIIGSICLITFIASRFIPYFYYFSNMRGDRQILIGKKYAYINGYFHNWDYSLSGLISVKAVKEPFPGIMIKYYYTDKTWRNEHTLVVPTSTGINIEDLIRKISD